jgi:hypothetical protein
MGAKALAPATTLRRITALLNLTILFFGVDRDVTEKMERVVGGVVYIQVYVVDASEMMATHEL